MIRKFLNDYLSFTRKERTGIIVILILILFFSFLPFFFPFFLKRTEPDRSSFEKELATLKYHIADSNTDEAPYTARPGGSYRNDPGADRNTKGELFYFDPNTLSAAGWQRLGLREKTITTIQHYIAKGGKFRQPADIGKIWGLHPAEVQRLLPFVSIPQATNAYPEKKEFYTTPFTKNYTDKPKYTLTPIDINTADTSAFIALPGIGSRLANRIVNFRDRLGGFYSIDQVGETYALPDSTFQKIKGRLLLGNTTVKKLNINSAGIDELKVNPYIRFALANAIVQYRQQHGKFATVADIKNIMMVTETIFNKLAPYLTVE